MIDSPPLFEEMLAAYPADKREMARRVYDRFANGDATEFFAQFFLLLDVYANYAKRIPAARSRAVTFEARDGGTLARDVVHYAVPLDFLVHRWLVPPDIENIFAFRTRKLRKRFSTRQD